MDIHFADNGLSTGEKVLRRESFRQLIGDVQQLPETQRTALLLREIDALSYEQIATRWRRPCRPSSRCWCAPASRWRRPPRHASSAARKCACELGEVAEGLVKISPPRAATYATASAAATSASTSRTTTTRSPPSCPSGPLLLLKQLRAHQARASAGPRHGAGARWPPGAAPRRGGRCRRGSRRRRRGSAAGGLVTAGRRGARHEGRRDARRRRPRHRGRRRGRSRRPAVPHRHRHPRGRAPCARTRHTGAAGRALQRLSRSQPARRPRAREDRLASIATTPAAGRLRRRRPTTRGEHSLRAPRWPSDTPSRPPPTRDRGHHRDHPAPPRRAPRRQPGDAGRYDPGRNDDDQPRRQPPASGHTPTTPHRNRPQHRSPNRSPRKRVTKPMPVRDPSPSTSSTRAPVRPRAPHPNRA